MHDLIVLFVHLVTTVLRILRPGGLRSVVAESLLIKHQLLIVNPSRRRAPNLRVLDRLIAGFCSLWIKPTRLVRATIAFKPSTLLHFHRALVKRKYHLLFSAKRRVKPGPKGPSQDVIRDNHVSVWWSLFPETLLLSLVSSTGVWRGIWCVLRNDATSCRVHRFRELSGDCFD